jgi:hypothetical protein
MMMKIQVVVFWVLTPCTDVVGYQCFGGPHCFHIPGEITGTGKGGTDIGREYNGVESMQASKKQGRTVKLVVKKQCSGIVDWNTEETNRSVRSLEG